MVDKSTWLKDNFFSIVNLIILIAGFAYGYGALNQKIANISDNLQKTQESNEKQLIVLQEKTDKRIITLEDKTNDLNVIKQIVSEQSRSIDKLQTLIQVDHDLIMKLNNK